MDRQAKIDELESLRERVRWLEAELAFGGEDQQWRRGYYTAYYATTGFLLGSIAACTSLLFNVVGSAAWSSVSGVPQHPLELIRVYLTFPLGAAALEIESGLTLAIGCCLYVGTGMLYGVLFQLTLARFAHDQLRRRLAVASGLALAIWALNFYGVLSWLQPALLGGRWILDLVPWWVAAVTHLVFGWTMALVYPLGVFIPYRADREVR
jgi:hypothetical protein